MKFNLWTQYGALNSKPVFEAFAKGAISLGHEVVYNSNSGIDVIWSVLFNGRMSGNKQVWDRNVATQQPTIVLEVGGIKRNVTWKMGINGINRDADFANHVFDDKRWQKFNIQLQPWKKTGNVIVICGQHDTSQQWSGRPKMNVWVEQQIKEIRKSLII